MNARHMALLEQLGAHVTSHSRRTLLDHLQGTHDLLAQWGNEPEICIAGLFHSVYGTYAFNKRSADMSMRDEIRDVIGTQAERMVYLFCVTDRQQGPWRNLEAVEFATLEWVDWFNNRRLLEPIGHALPAELEEAYYRQMEESARAA